MVRAKILEGENEIYENFAGPRTKPTDKTISAVFMLTGGYSDPSKKIVEISPRMLTTCFTPGFPVRPAVCQSSTRHEENVAVDDKFFRSENSSAGIQH